MNFQWRSRCCVSKNCNTVTSCITRVQPPLIPPHAWLLVGYIARLVGTSPLRHSICEMPETISSPSQRLFVFISLTILCLVLGSYNWQSRERCSSLTTTILSPVSPPIPENVSERNVTPVRFPSPTVPSPVLKRPVVEYPPTLLPLFSKDIIVRSVYFDDRPRNEHQNASVFMVEARRGLVNKNLFLGCQIGEYFSKYTKVRLLAQVEWVHHRHPHINHDLFMVDCFDLPVKNGSRAFLVFKNGASKSVESERPLFFPAPRISHGKDIKILVCVATPRYTTYNYRLTLYGMLYHWLKYQRVIGVDHVHFIANPSLLEVGSLQNDVVRKAILDQFLSIEFWEPWLNDTDNFYHSQMLAYEDCAYKFRGTYDYIVMCDIDDFFVPRIPSKPKLHYYIQKWCPHGACCFRWFDRYPDYGLDEHAIEDGNMTKSLKCSKAKKRGEHKSLFESSMVLDVGIHRPLKTISGYSIKDVPSSVAYFAHIRHGIRTKGC